MMISLPLALAGAAFGCTRSARPAAPPPLPPRPLPQCAVSAPSAPPDSIRARVMLGHPGEDVILRVGRTVPGGLTSLEGDATGRMVLQMVDTTYADTVRAALAAAFAPDTARGRPSFAAGIRDAEVRRVAYSRVDLDAWRAYLGQLLWNDARGAGGAVSAIGSNWRRVRVEVMVPTEEDRAWVELRLARADIPCDLVETELGGFTVGPRSASLRVRSPR